MTLDESNDTKEQITEVSDIKFMIDPRVQWSIDSGNPLVIGYRESVYGSGFTLDNGSGCHG